MAKVKIKPNRIVIGLNIKLKSNQAITLFKAVKQNLEEKLGRTMSHQSAVIELCKMYAQGDIGETRNPREDRGRD